MTVLVDTWYNYNIITLPTVANIPVIFVAIITALLFKVSMATVRFTNENTELYQSVELLPCQVDVIKTAKLVDEGKAEVSHIVTLLNKIENRKANPLQLSYGMWPKMVEKRTLRQEVLKYLAPSSLDSLEKAALEMGKKSIGADCRFLSDCWKEKENKIRRERQIIASLSSISF